MQIAMKMATLAVTAGLCAAAPTAERRPRNRWPARETASKIETYKKTPQGELKMYIHFPPGWKAADKRPAIVFFGTR